MRERTAPLLALAAIASMAIATTTAAATAAPRAASTATVSSRTNKLGRILVDAHGRTLYLFLKDQHGKSACSGACAKAWPPLMTSGKPKVARGAEAKMLGTTHRASGRRYLRRPSALPVRRRREGRPDERRGLDGLRRPGT